MSARLKSILLDNGHKAFINGKEVLNVKSFHISYKHIEKIFVITLNNNKSPANEKRFDFKSNINVERNAFLKKVLGTFKDNEPSVKIERKNVVIDFSSPNIAKPFHVGHLRSSIIGNFIANINKYYQNNVTKLNYLGDWGTQFGLLQYGLHTKNIDIDELAKDPIRKLYEIYVEVNELSQKDENVQCNARKYFSDIEKNGINLKTWDKIREITISELERTYKRLGIKFDEYHWESDYNRKEIEDLLEELEKSNILINDISGKKVIKVNNRNVTVLKSDNSTLYLTRDIAALLDRYKKFNFDKMLYIVDNAQTDHFLALFDIVSRIKKECVIGCEHIKFGRIRGMSTRKGNVIFLNDILDEAKQKMHEKQKQSKNTRMSARNDTTCDILGTTAVIINDLKQRRQRDYEFDWDKALQSEGDSGIKLQYLHCRLWSLEKNCGISLPDECEPMYLGEEIVGDVVAELLKFDDVLQRSYNEYEACILVNYLFRLARNVNRMFNELRVKDVTPNIAAQRLLVFHRARIIIKTSLEILGVKPLYEM